MKESGVGAKSEGEKVVSVEYEKKRGKLRIKKIVTTMIQNVEEDEG